MLYFVSTPIGNLGDISYRAVETLKVVDVIACEDTRHSTLFLNKYSIKKPLISYHKFNERECASSIIGLLKDGKDVAVISDAGTPLISDPGNALTKMLIEEELKFTVIPGATAFVPALILSGLEMGQFCFIGFLPDKRSDALNLVEGYASVKAPLIFYVPPHDLDKALEVLFQALGRRNAVAVREVTKIYEERISFVLGEPFSGKRRGEFVIIVEGIKDEGFKNLSALEHIQLYLKSGMSKMDAIKQTAKERGIKKGDLYKQYLDNNQTED